MFYKKYSKIIVSSAKSKYDNLFFFLHLKLQDFALDHKKNMQKHDHILHLETINLMLWRLIFRKLLNCSILHIFCF